MNIRVHVDGEDAARDQMTALKDLRFELRHVLKEVKSDRGPAYDHCEEYYVLVDEEAAYEQARKVTGFRDVEFLLPMQMPMYGQVPFSRLTIRLDENGVPVSAWRG